MPYRSGRANKRRKTSNSFVLTGQRQMPASPAAEPAWREVQSAPSAEQVNGACRDMDIDPKYQGMADSDRIKAQDERIREQKIPIQERQLESAKKDLQVARAEIRVAELEGDVKQQKAIIAQQDEKIDELEMRMAYLQEGGRASQEAKIEELTKLLGDNGAQLKIKEDEIRDLGRRLSITNAALRDLLSQSFLVRLLDWIETPPIEPFQFMFLPGELRDTVYKECLVADRPIDLWPVIPYDAPRGTTRAAILSQNLKSLNIPLLRVSRQVNMEATRILYGCNRFRFSDVGGWTVLEGFLLNLRNTFKYLTNISVVCPDRFWDFWDSEGPFEITYERAQKEMQPILNRFNLTINSPIGPSLSSYSARGHVELIIWKLPSLQSFTLVVPPNARLEDIDSPAEISRFLDRRRRITDRNGRIPTAKASIVFLRRPDAKSRVVQAGLIQRISIDTAPIEPKLKDNIIKWGKYCKFADRMSYTVDRDEEPELEVAPATGTKDRGFKHALKDLYREIRRVVVG